jgi:hypothetical protein
MLKRAGAVVKDDIVKVRRRCQRRYRKSPGVCGSGMFTHISQRLCDLRPAG